MPQAITVHTILAPNPSPMTGPGTNTYILSAASGQGGCTVIDPGVDTPSHLTAILDYCAIHGGIERILITHAHPDHIGGSAELATLSNTPVCAMNLTSRGVPHATVQVHDGDMLPIGEHTVTVIATPGHRFDHCSLWFSLDKWLLAGDLLAGQGTVVIIPPDGNMIDYLASLQQVQQLPIVTLYPGHFDPIANPHAYIEQYIQHRHQREALIIEILSNQEHPVTLSDLTPMIYTDTPPTMYRWASMSLLAHLIKLEQEHRCTRHNAAADEGPWSLIRS